MEDIIDTIILGNSLDKIKEIPIKKVQSIITSPPYYALRNYNVEGQIGLEKDFNQYLDKLINIFDECKRVLKDDGLLFVVISDTYFGSGDKSKQDNINKGNISSKSSYVKSINSYKKKCLLGIPQRFMIKMIDNGWICRNQIIWRKPNAMPSSVKDRFTVDYETIFMFSKNGKYLFNQLKEPMKTIDTNSPRGSKGVLGSLNKGLRKQDQIANNMYIGFNDRYTPPYKEMFGVFGIYQLNL